MINKKKDRQIDRQTELFAGMIIKFQTIKLNNKVSK